MAVNEKKKMIENASAIVMKTGAAVGGADKSRLGALLGRTDVLYVGESDGEVQLTPASLFGREQEPNVPRKRLGPSTPWLDPG